MATVAGPDSEPRDSCAGATGRKVDEAQTDMRPTAEGTTWVLERFLVDVSISYRLL